MKKLSIITILCLFVISMGTMVSAEEAAKPQRIRKGVVESAQTPLYNIAVIPYINSTEETKGYIDDTVNNKYIETYSNKEFQMISPVEVQKALDDVGYDISNMELPEKDILASVAKATNADYVIAMEISQLVTTRHMSYFQAKVVTKAKLRYKFYNEKQDKMVSFQVTGASENKTVFGGVGYKEPITKALSQAMDDANQKIKSYL